MDENQQINENHEVNGGIQVNAPLLQENAHLPQEQNAPEYYKRKEFEYRATRNKRYFMRIKLAETKAKETLGEVGLNRRYTARVKGQGYSLDAREAKAQAREKHNELVTTESYRFLKKFNATVESFKNELDKVFQFNPNDLSEDAKRKIQELEQKKNDDFASVENNTYDQVVAARVRQRIADWYMEDRVKDSYVQKKVSEACAGNKEQIIERIKAEYQEKINGIRQDDIGYKNKLLKKSSVISAFFTEGDTVANKVILNAAINTDSPDRMKVVEGLAMEVLSYDFSEKMLNINWLSENGDVFARMIKRTEGLLELLDEDRDLYNKIDRELHIKLRTKKMEALDLLEFASRNARYYGMKFEGNKKDKLILESNVNERNRRDQNISLVDDNGLFFHKQRLKNDARELLDDGLKNEKTDSREAMEIPKLKLADFLNVLGTKNRGQVVLSKNGGLSMINTGYFRRNVTGDVNRENMIVKQHFLKLVLDQLTEDEKEYYEPLFRSIVGLNKNGNTSKPLSRKDILSVINEIRNRESVVKKTIRTKQGTNLAGFAAKVDVLFGEEVLKEDVKQVRTRKIRTIRGRMKTIIRNAEGIRVPSDSKLDKLITENMSLLKDEIFKAAVSFDTILKNTGKAEENTFLGAHNQNQILEKLAAHAIKKLCTSSASEADIREYDMDRFVTTEALRTAGEPNLINRLSDVYMGNLVNGETLGLYEVIEERKARYAELVKKGNFAAELDAFAMLIDNLSSLANVNAGLLGRVTADAGVNKNEVMDTARTVQHLMTDVPGRFDAIAEMLKGTRFAKGYEELKAKINSGFDFVQNEQEILDKLSKHRNVAERADVARADRARLRALNMNEKILLSGLSSREKALANILMLKTMPSSLIKKDGDENAQAIMALRNTISKVSADKAFTMQTEIDGITVRLTQREDGSLRLGFGEKVFTVPVPVNRIAQFIEADMCSNVSKYGAENVYGSCFTNINIVDCNFGQIARIRDLSIKVLVSISKKTAAHFENVSTENLVKHARDYLLGGYSERDADILVASGGKSTINDEETHIFIKMLDKIEQEEREQQVNAPVVMVEQAVQKNENEPQWTPEELKVKALIADMIYGSTYETDRDIEEKDYNKRKVEEEKEKMLQENGAIDETKLERSLTSGYMMRRSLYEHADAVSLILHSPNMDIVDQTLRRMSVPDAPEGQADFKKTLADGIKEGMGVLKDDLELEELDEDAIRQKLKENLDNKDNNKKYGDAYSKIQKGVEECCKYMQGEIKTAAESIFNFQDNEPDNEQLPPLNEAGIAPEELARRKNEHSEELAKRIKREALNSSGQGAFNKKVLCEYFTESKIEDKMAMVASIFKNSVPKRELPQNATDEEKEAERVRMRGNTLSGYLKGAGPLMQKMLQGMPEQALPPEMKIAVKDMKSKLMPIPENVIKARMRSIVERSGGNITKIEVTKSLGAASVGQAFLCKLFGPALPEAGRNVVIKLLRPDARNRMVRERDIMKKCADAVDDTGSMKGTMEGQMNRIAEELDLSKEGENIKLGTVYNEGAQTVKSVGVCELVEPTTNTLVLEMAEGTTVDSYIEEVKKKRFDVMKNFFESAGGKVVIDPVSKKPKMLDDFDRNANVSVCRRELEAVLARLEMRQKYLATTAEKWVSEGIYGEGFYHGDLHAGNIMINDKGVTLIDFGNATRLTEDQKKYLTRLTAAAAAGETEDFLESFFILLGPEAKEKYRAKMNDFTNAIKKVFKVGNKENAGQRISLIIMKAQSLKIEVPDSISNFSQSQMRLQNTIEDVNKLIDGVKEDLANLDAIDMGNVKVDIQEKCQHEARVRNVSLETVVKEYSDKINTVSPEQLMEKARLTGENERNQFRAEFIDRFGNETESVTNMKNALERLHELQDHPENETAENSLMIREAEFVSAYMKASNELILTSDTANGVREQLMSKDENVVAKVEKELESYFKDKEKLGPQLENLYKELKAAKNANADEAEVKAKTDAFLQAYLSVVGANLNRTLTQKKNIPVKPKQFFAVMTGVLMNNLATSLKRFGFFKAKHYRDKLA